MYAALRDRPDVSMARRRSHPLGRALWVSWVCLDRVMTIIAVTGIPGSGKTTLATSLGTAMGLSVVSKDVIKESLMDTLGTGDKDWASTLSRAAHGVMYRLVDGLVGDVILEAHFHAGTAEPALQSLGHRLVQVYCHCPVEIAWQRYKIRRDDPARHPGHLPEHQDEEATAGWRSRPPQPLALDAPLLTVDTSVPVDVDSVAIEVRELMST
jgi:predicted kinase